MATQPFTTGAPTRAPGMKTNDRRQFVRPGEAGADPATLPRHYASTCIGTCLEPVIPDGTTLVFARDEQPTRGDFVGLWIAHDDGTIERMVKRLALALPPKIAFTSAGGDLVPLVVCEMLNPPRRLTWSARRVLGVHKVIGWGLIDAAGTVPTVEPLSTLSGCSEHGR